MEEKKKGKSVPASIEVFTFCRARRGATNLRVVEKKAITKGTGGAGREVKVSKREGKVERNRVGAIGLR